MSFMSDFRVELVVDSIDENVSRSFGVTDKTEQNFKSVGIESKYSPVSILATRRTSISISSASFSCVIFYIFLNF